MARNEQPPFDRGSTWYNGGTIDANNLGGQQIVGREWLFEDINITTKQLRSNKFVRCRAVRNVSGVSVLPKHLVQFQYSNSPAGGTGVLDPPVTYGAEVSGYTTSSDGQPADPSVGHGYPVDEFVAAAGVPNNDIFWIVVDGPAMCLTAQNALNGNINVGDKVVACGTTAATTGVTGGCVDAVSYVNNTQCNATTQRQNVRQEVNFIGYACSAITSGQTNTSILVDVGKW